MKFSHRNIITITAYFNIFLVLPDRKECIGYIGSFEVILTNQSYGRERGIGRVPRMTLFKGTSWTFVGGPTLSRLLLHSVKTL
jgi:hypothetical protein